MSTDPNRRMVLLGAAALAASVSVRGAPSAANNVVGRLPRAVGECSDAVYYAYVPNLEAAIMTGDVTSAQCVSRAAMTLSEIDKGTLYKSVRQVFKIPDDVSDDKIFEAAEDNWALVSEEIYKISTPKQAQEREEVIAKKREKIVQRKAEGERRRIAKILKMPNLMHEPYEIYD